MKTSALALIVLSAGMTGCVTSGRFKAQQAETLSQKQRADSLTADLAAVKKSLQDVQSQLKATQDQLAQAQKSNKDLEDSLEAKKSELSKKVSELIQERDSLTQQVADLQKKLADADTAKAAVEAAKAAEIEQMKKSYEDLTSGLKSEIAAGEIKITQLQGKLTVNMVDRILFDSGRAEIKTDGQKVLDKLGQIFNTVQDKNIRIEGHTDNVPIAANLQSKYPTNWELSTARATAVARYLEDHDKVDPTRLIAAGFGEFHPVSVNDTPEGRALNRRIEIVLVPKD